jgi:peptide/nickel transport system ATP-binding protein
MTKVQGCRFAPRCPFAVARCRAEDPPLMAMGEGQEAACWRAPLDALLADPAPTEALA